MALAPGALNHQGELLVARRGPACGVKFQCPSRKDPFEARMRISSQHTASAATALSLDVIRFNRATSRPCAACRLASKFSPRRPSFIGARLRVPRANVAYGKETEVT